jgi:hypothetical protein
VGLGYLKEAYESIPGNEANTPTLSTKVLYSPFIGAKPDPGVEHLDRSDENRNLNQHPPLLTDTYSPSWGDYEVRMYPDVTAFRLKHILGDPVITAGDGIITDPDGVIIPVGVSRLVWAAPFGPSGASPLTTEQIYAYADQSVFWKIKGAACSSLEIENPEEGGSRLSAEGVGLYGTRISNPSLAPAYESLAIRPFSRGNLTLPNWLSGSGTHENFGLKIDNPVEPVRSMGIASKSPDVMEKGEEMLGITGTLDQRQLDADDVDALINATAFSATARWVSESIIAAGYPYKLFVAMPNCQYHEGEFDTLENKRRHGASFGFRPAYSGSGSEATITLCCATPSLA